MKKFWTRDGPLILLLLFLLTACGTATTPSPVDIQLTQMISQVQACATLEALGTPYPCNPPTATSTPIPPTYTPTATPFQNGWMHYPEGGGATPMPPGFQPSCDGLVGCPGNSYTYFKDGVPQNGVPGGTAGTPGYWPWLPLAIFAGLAVLGAFYFAAYGMAAPARARAKVMLMMADVQKQLMMSASQQKALPIATNGAVTAFQLARSLRLYAEEGPAEAAFQVGMLPYFKGMNRHDSIPLDTVASWLLDYDTQHRTSFHVKFPEYAKSVDFRRLG